jgi:hypothetical protein
MPLVEEKNLKVPEGWQFQTFEVFQGLILSKAGRATRLRFTWS